MLDSGHLVHVDAVYVFEGGQLVLLLLAQLLIILERLLEVLKNHPISPIPQYKLDERCPITSVSRCII